MKTGLSEVMGSWKIMEISSPLMARRRSGEAPRNSSPLYSTDPPLTRPGGGTRPKRLKAVMVLPQPLSPTRPRISPGIISRLTPSTAASGPAAPGNSVTRSCIETNGWVTYYNLQSDKWLALSPLIPI